MTGKLKYAVTGCGLVLASSLALANQNWEEKDANKDGRISRAEFITAAEEEFSSMDTNNDSVLSQNEFDEHSEHMQDKYKSREKDS
ncbi:MAG TPA: hypothetical protein VFX02_08210 [Gammaproteobacteria bacterium]|nr:hypothetical protein [Gammaproteobacteria bacterium]